uniref:HMG box domain-containing protein n=1 Tax=Musca domestica TaxID=7370 RepID=A0A1I8MBM7_MUSDO
METPNTNKEFEVTGVSRSGRIRKKSSKLLDFQSPDESIQRKIYKRTSTSTGSRSSAKHGGRGRPSLAALRARKQTRPGQEAGGDANDMAEDDDEMDNEHDLDDKNMSSAQDRPAVNTEDDDDDGGDMDDGDDDDMADDDEHLDDVMGNNATESDDDGFGELVADLVGTEGSAGDRNSQKPDSNVRKSLYMSEKRSGKDGRLERKDKGKSRYTAYSLWAREYRKTANFGKEVDFTTARRELWANVSNKEKNNWRRKAKIQATKAKAMERSGGAMNRDKKLEASPSANATNSTFINRPTTSRTKKLQLQAEEKQKAKESNVSETKAAATTPTSRRTRNNSYNRKTAANKNSNTVALYANGSNYDAMGNASLYNSNTPLPTIEPIDAAAHLKLLGESLTIIGERLKDHEGQIAVSGSLSVLLDSLLCSLGPLLCLTTCLPGLEKKTKLKTNLAVTLDNIAYVMPGL